MKILIEILDGISALGGLRIFLGAGLGALLGGLAFYFSPNVAAALRKSDEKPTISVSQAGSGNIQNNYFTDRGGETERLVSQAQFAKVSEIESFFGGKNESDLRSLFDMQVILIRNIETQIIRIGMISAGKESEFLYNKYTDNGSWIMWAKEGYFTTGPNGVHLNSGPLDVHHLVTTSKYQRAVQQLIQFSNSALVPVTLKKEIAAFESLIGRDMELMMVVMDQRMHEDRGYFTRHGEMYSPYYGVIQNDFAGRVEHLKPHAERILELIASMWKVSGTPPSK